MLSTQTAWEPFVDALLQREAVLCRAHDGLAPRDFAGMYVDQDDVDRILRQLPGLNGPARTSATELHQVLDPVVERAWVSFQAWVGTFEGPDDGTCAEESSPIGLLFSGLHLTEVEIQTLAVIAGIEQSPDRQRLAVYLQDNVNQPRATVDLVRRLLRTDSALRPESTLRSSCLIELVGDGPWSSRMAALTERVSWFIAGSDQPDAHLPPGVRFEGVGPGGGRAHRNVPRPHLAPTQLGGRPAIRFVIGADPTARRRVACEGGSGLLVSPLPTSDDEWDALVREASIQSLRPCIELVDTLPASTRARIERHHTLEWVVSAPSELPLEQMPSVPWTELRIDSESDRQFEDHNRLVALAQSALGGGRAAAVRRLARGHLDSLATRIPPRRGWHDLVVHPEQLEQLRNLANRHRHADRVYAQWQFRAVPSAGLIAVFAGPSGTGKTLSAEVIAADLDLDLYKIDLSAVVSKYIGETEKNLEQIFHAASSGSVVLFFDEADALFGKRSEVGDAHDRYANIEVSYLLQRLEAYDGLIILATNLQNNMDNAFLRRIHVAVDFTLPDQAERRAIWELSFPNEAPVEDLDLDFLARQFKVSGGTIRNTALGAAFLAAGAETPIGMVEVVRSMSREFNKLGRLRTPEEFGQYFELITQATGNIQPMAKAG